MAYVLGKNILATVTYYDVLDFPVTSFEIWKHLISYDRDTVGHNTACSLDAVEAALPSVLLSGKLVEKNGFYTLPGREVLIQERIQKEKISVQKLKGMKRLARLIACVPYVRMVGATGSLAMKHGSVKSDWDMFVVLASGRIWIGRTLLTGFLHLIGKRRHGRKIVDRACLNYFVTDENLEIGTKDLYSAHEYRFIIPLLNAKMFQKFELANTWIQKYKPNMLPASLSNRFLVAPNRFTSFVQSLLEKLFDFFSLESWLRSWQQVKIERNPNTRLEGSLIEATDRALIFLPHPRGPRVFEKFKERFSA
ncbi:MAG: hypothetical protein AAB519_02770 [Patescibacteria group bacterium]